jgi:hypothetical protein
MALSLPVVGNRDTNVPPALMFQSELDEYIQVPSPNYRIALAFRLISTQGKIAGGALTYAQRMRMYYLSEVANTPKHRFIDPINERYAISPLHDGGHFKDVIDILEPIGAEDEVTTGMLAALGIQ